MGLSLSPISGGPHPLGGAQWKRDWFLESEIDNNPGTPKIPLAKAGGCFGHQDIVRSPEGLEICLQGQKKDDLGRCPDDFYHLPTSIFSLLWGGGGETCVWCLFAQGRVVRVWRDGRGWKALVASRFKAQKGCS